MKILPSALIAGVLLAGAVGCSSSDHDFNGVVSVLEHRYSIEGHRVPMMGLAGFCARVATHGGLKGLRVAQFGHLAGRPLEADDISRVIGEQLGPEWRPVVKDHEQHGREQSVIFVRPVGDALRMLIANYENGELSIVRVELDGARLSKWMKDPGDPTAPSRHADPGNSETTASIGGGPVQ